MKIELGKIYFTNSGERVRIIDSEYNIPGPRMFLGDNGLWYIENGECTESNDLCVDKDYVPQSSAEERMVHLEERVTSLEQLVDFLKRSHDNTGVSL